MIKQARFLAVSKEVCLGWVYVLFLASLVDTADVIRLPAASPTASSNDTFLREFKITVTLETKPEVLAPCGEDLALSCTANTENGHFTHIELEWTEVQTKRKLCKLVDHKAQNDSGSVMCSAASSDPESNHQLVLTLPKMKPANQGEYKCKLRSNLGIKDANTNVILQGCLGKSESGYSKEQSQMHCHFHGFYPAGTVHWFHGATNLTDSSTTVVEKRGELFNVESVLPLQTELNTQSHHCMLWIPTTRSYASSLPVLTPETLEQTGQEKPKSSGDTIKFHWISVIVALFTMTVVI